MHGNRVVVAALAAVVAAAGCTPHRLQTEVSGGYESPAAHAHLPAPANPDLAAVMERFYQQVEGAHWPFAYAMLSPRYRATLRRDAFVARYERLGEMDVSLQQRGDRVVIATLGAVERGTPPRTRKFEETTTLAWDGEDWRIERITRRDVSPSRTR